MDTRYFAQVFEDGQVVGIYRIADGLAWLATLGGWVQDPRVMGMIGEDGWVERLDRERAHALLRDRGLPLDHLDA
jgi:hypothetical protein